MSQTSDWNGPICYCGEQVAVYHKECIALRQAEEEINEPRI